MRAFLVAAVAALAAAANVCAPSAQCTFVDGKTGIAYEVGGLCNENGYTFNNTKSEQEYAFNICGNVPDATYCLPDGYTVPGGPDAAILFFGPAPPAGSQCVAPNGTEVPCTAYCEPLGNGAPVLALLDPSAPLSGINVTYTQGSGPYPNDPFQCPTSPVTGLPIQRSVTYSVACDPKRVLAPLFLSAAEVSTCQYVISLQHALGCGCKPYCTGRQCGSNGCAGTCGTCPPGDTCTPSGTCEPKSFLRHNSNSIHM